MIDLLIIVAMAVIVGFVLRAIALIKIRALALNATARQTFFDLADDALERTTLTRSELDGLKFMAQNIMSRFAQWNIMKAYSTTVADEIYRFNEKTRSEFDHSTEEQSLWWGKLYFYWLLAVSSQGSLLAIGAIDIIFTHFDVERRIGLKEADRCAERVVYQLSHAGSH
ncbi:MAG: hypothetical protein JO357_11900 [Hyphomicrobiales bacterium]|nr:hypothetical protein [Hyphomicrobiales bacterium]MBV9050936.1 hypothetical protein [Hyphomicrobiales bacterium]MBV9137751.1 hypothetical protein [Hyphomicrobiales bacterium]MBV9975660.1 hypothetical protein [Hyphomicrobiales bacterium]